MRTACLTLRPALLISLASSARDGRVFKYSMILGSTPALRIKASVLREVMQLGLWYIVMSIMGDFPLSFLRRPGEFRHAAGEVREMVVQLLKCKAESK